jgi:hypothetical protein
MKEYEISQFDRGKYWICVFGASFALFIIETIVPIFRNNDLTKLLTGLGLFAGVIVLFYASSMRLQNLGWSRALLILFFTPVNLLLVLALLFVRSKKY